MILENCQKIALVMHLRICLEIPYIRAGIFPGIIFVIPPIFLGYTQEIH